LKSADTGKARGVKDDALIIAIDVKKYVKKQEYNLKVNRRRMRMPFEEKKTTEKG